MITGKKLLLVDDETALLVPMKRFFERLGNTAATAQSAAEAIAALSVGPFDLVVLDLRLSADEHGGLEVLRQVRGTHPATRVLILSGMVTPESEAEARRLGADAVLLKPQRLQYLAAVAHELVG